MKKLQCFSIFILIGILFFSLFFPACSKDIQNGSEGEGKLYTLAQAYEERKITREYLLNIAYYQGSAEDNQDELNENFTPLPKGELTENVSLQIRTALADMYYKKYGFTDTAEDFIVTNFYGHYDNMIAFYYKHLNSLEGAVAENYKETIDDVTFIKPVYIFLSSEKEETPSLNYTRVILPRPEDLDETLAYRIDSVEELQIIFKEPDFQFTPELLNAYDEKFFQTHAIIYYATWVSGLCVTRTFSGLFVEDNCLVVRLDNYVEGDGIDDAVYGVVYAFALEKTQIADCETITLQEWGTKRRATPLK